MSARTLDASRHRNIRRICKLLHRCVVRMFLYGDKSQRTALEFDRLNARLYEVGSVGWSPIFVVWEREETERFHQRLAAIWVEESP